MVQPPWATPVGGRRGPAGPAPAVQVVISLDRTTVHRGQAIQVKVDIVNNTGHPGPRGQDCNPPEVIVYLTNGKLSNQGGIGEPGCGETAGAPQPTLSAGHHRSTQTLQTVYSACLEPGGASIDPTYPPPCAGATGPPALPAGPYRTAVELLHLPAGTVAPGPVPVTILPDPVGGSGALGGIPDGWGRLTGHLGPDDLMWPAGGCQDLSGPPTRSGPAR